MPEIMAQNKNVRFAILAGDQIYGDEVEVPVRNEPDLRKRQELYLGVYKKFWDTFITGEFCVLFLRIDVGRPRSH